MAKFSSGDGVVSLDNSGGSLQDVSDDIQTLVIDITINGSTNHHLGSPWAFATEGGKMGTVTFTFYDDPDPTSLAGYIREWVIQTSAKGGARTLRVDTPDSTAGSVRQEMEIKPGGSFQLVNLTAGSGDPHLLQATFNIDGEVVDSVISS